MTLDNITFTASGCWAEINGIRCELDSKLAFLRAGGSYLRALDPVEQPAADALMDTRIGGSASADSDEWEAWACADPRLVMLDIRCAEWRADEANAPWLDTAQTAPSQEEAMQFIMTWLAQSQPQ